MDAESKLPFKVTNTMVNSFFLNGMEVATATMDKIDFRYAIFMGYIERNIPKNVLAKADEDARKALRLEKTKDGTAPS